MTFPNYSCCDSRGVTPTGAAHASQHGGGLVPCFVYSGLNLVSSFHKASEPAGKLNVNREQQLGSPSLHPLPHPWWTQPAPDFCSVHHWPSRLAQLYPVLEKLSSQGPGRRTLVILCCPSVYTELYCQVPTLWDKGADCHLEQPSPTNSRSPRQRLPDPPSVPQCASLSVTEEGTHSSNTLRRR